MDAEVFYRLVALGELALGWKNHQVPQHVEGYSQQRAKVNLGEEATKEN